MASMVYNLYRHRCIVGFPKDFSFSIFFFCCCIYGHVSSGLVLVGWYNLFGNAVMPEQYKLVIPTWYYKKWPTLLGYFKIHESSMMNNGDEMKSIEMMRKKKISNEKY